MHANQRHQHDEERGFTAIVCHGHAADTTTGKPLYANFAARYAGIGMEC